jgi:hypothetical protein
LINGATITALSVTDVRRRRFCNLYGDVHWDGFRQAGFRCQQRSLMVRAGRCLGRRTGAFDPALMIAGLVGIGFGRRRQ